QPLAGRAFVPSRAETTSFAGPVGQVRARGFLQNLRGQVVPPAFKFRASPEPHLGLAAPGRYADGTHALGVRILDRQPPVSLELRRRIDVEAARLEITNADFLALGLRAKIHRAG